jgi:hypothetical protein
VSKGETYAGDLPSCSNIETYEGSGLAVFTWLADLYRQPPLMVLSQVVPIVDSSQRTEPPRANLCLQHALTGEPLPIHSQSMRDIMEHCGLLNASEPSRFAYQQEARQESPGLSEMDRVFIRQFDQKLFQDHCTGCHSRY